MLTITRPISFSSNKQESMPVDTDFRSVARVWDLTPGDNFRGRTVTAIRGVVSLAHSPVAVIFFSGSERPARISATHSEALQYSGEITLRAREWIRSQGLGEGDGVDLEMLRTEVLSVAGHEILAAGASMR